MSAPWQSASSTPILDSGLLPQPRRKNTILGFLFGLLVGVLFILVVLRAGTQDQSETALFSYFGVLFLAVIIHELGHLFMGWIVGFHFNSIALGPIVFGFEYGKLTIRLRRGTGLLGHAGIQVDRVMRLRHRFLLFIIGGPTASLVSAAVAAFLIKCVFSKSWLVPVSAGYAYLSLLIGSAGFLPLWPKSRSDGSRMWMLLTSREKTRRLISTLALLHQTKLGIPLKLWKKTWLNATTAVRDDSFDEFTSNWIAFCAASARKDVPKLTAHLERCLELASVLPDAKRDEIAREAGIYVAWFRNDAGAAEKWFAQRKYSNQTTRIMQIRMKVALDCARRDFASSFKGIEEGANIIESLPNTPYREVLRESWREWQDELTKKQSQLVRTSQLE